jgi:hypothetical protein
VGGGTGEGEVDLEAQGYDRMAKSKDVGGREGQGWRKLY